MKDRLWRRKIVTIVTLPTCFFIVAFGSLIPGPFGSASASLRDRREMEGRMIGSSAIGTTWERVKVFPAGTGE